MTDLHKEQTRIIQNIVRLEENYNHLIKLDLNELSNTFAIYKEVGKLCFRIKAARQRLAKIQAQKEIEDFN